MGIYQGMIVAYREPEKMIAKQLMRDVIDSVGRGNVAALVEICRLGRTLPQRTIDMLPSSTRWVPLTDSRRPSSDE